jgi:oxygen-independent coproporphyrinogen-3 oxidase
VETECLGGELAGSDLAESDQNIVRHLYVHIPFCARICPYCAFYKERADPAQTLRFCEAIVKELGDLAARFAVSPETIFFGGGTPTALSTDQLGLLLNGFRDLLDLSALREWTIEANPGSVSARKAAMLSGLGVPRISLGVQSWDDGLLQMLGREHNAAQAEASFRILRHAGLQNVSIDLMFGLPGQSLSQWEQTLARTIELEPDHISAYCLTYEEDTEFFARQLRGEYREDIETDAQFFETTMRMLESAGYQQYEISNYVHNRGYWSGANYLGVGPSAFSTVGQQRWQNIADYRIYSDRVLSGVSPVGSVEPLSSAMKRGEQIALSLRTRDGVPGDWLARWAAERQEFIELGLLVAADDRFVLTPKGKLLADSVSAAFV